MSFAGLRSAPSTPLHPATRLLSDNTKPPPPQSQTNAIKPAGCQRFASLHTPRSAPVSSSPASSCGDGARHFRVYYTARSNKKHKSYSDGVLLVRNRQLTLYDESGQLKTKSVIQSGARFHDGATFCIGGIDCEIQCEIAEREYTSGRVFIAQPANITTNDENQQQSTAPRAHILSKPFVSPSIAASSATTTTTGASTKTQRPTTDHADTTVFILNRDSIAPSASADTASALTKKRKRTFEHPVVVDNQLARQLRPHQRDGLQFIYDCVMGRKQSDHYGCILADAMGLGKSLTSIALIYTLLKQGPKHGAPVIRKAVIVCPSTLLENWYKEIQKWLGRSRSKPMIIQAKSKDDSRINDINAFIVGNVHDICIISYEMFRLYHQQFITLDHVLYVCDEGHRLKNSSGNQTINSLNAIRSRKRLILTGTPIQNNLLEFYAMCDFVNPNILGSLHAFKQTFEKPIAASRDTGASLNDKRLGDERSAELSHRTAAFVLRRTADVLRRYLPAKYEFVVFCRLSNMQTALYQSLLKTKSYRMCLSMDNDALALTCIQSLKKLANHPRLIFKQCQADAQMNVSDSELAQTYKLFPTDFHSRIEIDVSLSGKLQCLYDILRQIRGIGEKVVVVSNHVETLDIIQSVCFTNKWQTLRLDGSTAQDKRQALVDRFNAHYNLDHFVFLLSAKAGGVGLNLIGGRRLILFDPDWNPAIDTQAMARVWRDGQTQTVYIYRLLATHTIDEKIFQRQLRKEEVAMGVVDGKKMQRNFDRATLRQIFAFDPTTQSLCDTLDVFRRQNTQTNTKFDHTISTQQAHNIAAELTDEKQHNPSLIVGGKVWSVTTVCSDLDNEALLSNVQSGIITCIFSRQSSSDDVIELTANNETVADIDVADVVTESDVSLRVDSASDADVKQRSHARQLVINDEAELYETYDMTVDDEELQLAQSDEFDCT